MSPLGTTRRVRYVCTDDARHVLCGHDSSDAAAGCLEGTSYMTLQEYDHANGVYWKRVGLNHKRDPEHASPTVG